MVDQLYDKKYASFAFQRKLRNYGVVMKGKNLDKRLASVDYLYVGGFPSDSRATLCIYADEIDLSSLTTSIGCQPTRARRKGEKDNDRPKVPPAPIGQWFLEAPQELAFVEKIKFLLEATTSDTGVWYEIRQTHDIQLRCVISLHSWNEGFSLLPEVLAEMGNRCWAILLSMYSAEGDEIVAAFLQGPDST